MQLSRNLSRMTCWYYVQEGGHIAQKILIHTYSNKKIPKLYQSIPLPMHSMKIKLRDRDVLPPLSESPFGSFPPEWNKNGSNCVDHVCDDIKIHCFTHSIQPLVQNEIHRSSNIHSVSLNKNTSSGGTVPSANYASKTRATMATTKQQTCNHASREDTNYGRIGPASGPGKAGAYKRQKVAPTTFRVYYERSDLPLCIQHAATRSLQWKVDVRKLDYHHYLPVFFDGLREIEEPFAFVAFEGCMSLLEHGERKIMPTIPQLIIPMKLALNTRHPVILFRTLKVLQKLVVSEEYIGEALVPYYRQLLPVLNLYKNRTQNLGDRIDYSQHSQNDINRIVNETLNILEIHGGQDAYINIKYIIPTYESCK